MGRPKKNPNQANSKPGIYGTKEILTDTNPLWQVILKRLQKIARIHGFYRIELPIFEDPTTYNHFYKSSPSVLSSAVNVNVGELNLYARMSGLPSVLRSYHHSKIWETQKLTKWMYFGNVVSKTGESHINSSYEYGFEILGSFSHLAEAQLIGALWNLAGYLGLDQAVLEINTTGTLECQKNYEIVLGDYLKLKKFSLCDACNEHLKGRVLNVLRCENLDCQAVVSEAPNILDYLDEESRKQFTGILEALDEIAIPYQLNPLYAGADGSCKTSFALKVKHKNSTILLGEGSYHEQLLGAISGGKPVASCFGFSGNVDNLLKAMELAEITVVQEISSEVFLVPLGELASKKSLRLFHDLITAHVSVYDHFGEVGVKNQLKQAELHKSPIALIMGQKEAIDEMVILRDVKSGMQEIFSYDKIVAEVKKRLGK